MGTEQSFGLLNAVHVNQEIPLVLRTLKSLISTWKEWLILRETHRGIVEVGKKKLLLLFHVDCFCFVSQQTDRWICSLWWFLIIILNDYISKKADQKCQSPTFAPEPGETTNPNDTTEREITISYACESFHRYFNEIFHRTSPLFLNVLY